MDNFFIFVKCKSFVLLNVWKKKFNVRKEKNLDRFDIMNNICISCMCWINLYRYWLLFLFYMILNFVLI